MVEAERRGRGWGRVVDALGGVVFEVRREVACWGVLRCGWEAMVESDVQGRVCCLRSFEHVGGR